MHDSVEIGSIRRYGATIRICKRFRSTASIGDFRRTFEGFELEAEDTVELKDGARIQMNIFVPRDAVDRLCGLLQAELQAQERSERQTP